MMRTSSLAAVAGAVALVVPGAVAVGTTAAHDRLGRQASSRVVSVDQAAILFTAPTVTLSSDQQHAAVRVQYQCRNSSRYKHYVVGSLQQGAEETAVTYGIGWRGEGGTRAARCTGKLVTETLQFRRSWWTETQGKALAAGEAVFDFSLSRHNAPGHGPGWYTVHSTVSVDKRVVVRAP